MKGVKTQYVSAFKKDEGLHQIGPINCPSWIGAGLTGPCPLPAELLPTDGFLGGGAAVSSVVLNLLRNPYVQTHGHTDGPE